MNNTQSDRFFFIINPMAGHRKGEKIVAYIQRFFSEKKCEFDFSFTQKQGHAAQLAKKAVDDGYTVVVAVGGDGTINEIGGSLIGTNVSLGVIPFGSGNGLARDLKIPMNLKKALNTLIEGSSTTIDCGKINNQHFFCTCGIGFDSHIAYLMSKTKGRGKWKYIWLVIRECFLFEPFEVKFNMNGKTVDQKIFLINFANTSQFGNNAYIAPGAQLNDGLFEVVIINPFRKLLYPFLGISLFLKKINKFSFVETHKTSEINLLNSSANNFHFDGEAATLELPASITILNKYLNVRVPKK